MTALLITQVQQLQPHHALLSSAAPAFEALLRLPLALLVMKHSSFFLASALSLSKRRQARCFFDQGR